MVKCNKDQVQRLQKALKLEKDPTLRQRIQMVLLREDGMTQPKVAELTGMSLSTVNRAHMAYDSGGVKGLRRKPTGGRRRENMTLKEEKAFLTTFTKAAGAGQLLNVRELKSAYEKQIGHPTSNSTMYDLLARHGWRKLMPRPFHPQRNIEAQEAFKKKGISRHGEAGPSGSRRQWSPVASYVCRRGPLWSHEPATTVLGSRWGKT
jgi:transposase